MQVIINAAMTVDGKIATASGSSAISSKQDLKRVHKLRASVDAIVVGISTVLKDDPRLTVRLVKGKNPVRVIVDSQARIPLNSRILRTASTITTIVAVTKRAEKEKVTALEKAGAKVLVMGEGRGQNAAVPHGVDLKELFSILKKMGLKRILVEGGGKLNWSLLQLGIVDELIVTVAPIIAGGKKATTLVEGKGFTNVSEGVRLRLKSVVQKKNGELVLHYLVD